MALCPSPNPQRAIHRLRLTVDHDEQGADRRIGSAAALLAVADRGAREAVASSELLLRQSHLVAERRDVDRRRYEGTGQLRPRLSQ